MPFISYGITLPYEQLERIELQKGLAGFMQGFAAPGGIVNHVTKKPTDTPVRSVDIGYGSDNIWREHADFGSRFGLDERFSYRFNATHEEGKTYTGGSVNRDTVSTALDARLTREITWSFAALYQKRRARMLQHGTRLAASAATGAPERRGP